MISLLEKCPDIITRWSDNNTFTPDTVSYGSRKYITITCEVHGDYQIRCDSYSNGTRCNQCASDTRAENNIRKNIEKHGDILDDFPELRQIRKNNIGISRKHHEGKKKWNCPECGHEWEERLSRQSLIGAVCPMCQKEEWDSRISSFPDYSGNRTGLPRSRSEDHSPGYVSESETLTKQWHPGNTLPPEKVSSGSGYRALWQCENGHVWEAFVYSRRNSNTGCPMCLTSSRVSTGEKELSDVIAGLVGKNNVILNSRQVISPYELDIYIPEKKIAVEYNGLYWHSDRYVERGYHHQKWLMCQEQGIQLITVWEDDWNHRREVVKDMITHKLGVSSHPRVYARNTEIVTMTWDEVKGFLESHHIQGAVSGSVYLGLSSGVQTVAVSVWRKNKDALYLDRYATSVTVVGGMGKLLKQGIRYAQETGCTKIVTFADHQVSDGGLYDKLGFRLDKDIRPDYMYVVDGQRVHKFNYRLKRFRNDPELVYVKGLSESELAVLNHLPRVWDCGKARYIFDVPC